MTRIMSVGLLFSLLSAVPADATPLLVTVSSVWDESVPISTWTAHHGALLGDDRFGGVQRQVRARRATSPRAQEGSRTATS